MYIIRRGLLIIILPLFPLLLFATAFDWGFVKTAGQPAAVKQIASESGIYDSLIPSLLGKVKQVDTRVGSLSANSPVVTAAANQAFPPSYIQKSAETIIDSVYAWLDGETAEPTFRLDLSAAKLNFADSLSSQFQQKAAGLPKCTTPYTTTSFDITSATCLPAGVTAAAVGQAVKNDVAGGKGFIENPVISATSVKDNNSGQSIFQGQLKSLPTQYRRLKESPTILVVLTLLTATAILLLSPSRSKGLRRLGITLLGVGLAMLVFSWALNKGVTTQLAPKITIKDNSILTDKVRLLVSDIAQRIDKNYWTFGGIYVLAGTAALAAPIIAGRRTRRAPASNSKADTEEPGTPNAEPPAPQSSTKPKRIPKIQ